jgi:hypothetical protein
MSHWIRLVRSVRNSESTCGNQKRITGFEVGMSFPLIISVFSPLFYVVIIISMYDRILVHAENACLVSNLCKFI